MKTIPIYIGLIALEGALLWFVAERARAGGIGIRGVIGRVPRTAGEWARDVAFAAALWGVWSLVTYAWASIWPSAPSARVASLLPVGPVEAAFWIVVSCSAGIAEELAFRGLLLRWAARRLQSVAAGITVQGILFGIAHGYQGLAPVLRITLYGIMFGIAATRRRSLVPVMLAHAWTDIASGLLRI